MDHGSAGSCWSLERPIAALKCHALSGRVDVTRPDSGVCLQVGGRELPGNWFCVKRDGHTSPESSAPPHEPSWPLSLADAYVRGADLVAGYRPVDDWPYSPQVYWRAGGLDSVPGVVGSLAILVSVQTELLDTHPQIVAESVIRAESTVRMQATDGSLSEPSDASREFSARAATGVCCFLHRLPGHQLSYAEFMPASDFQSARVSQGDDGNSALRWRLFAEFLEKGVIRRARVHGAFVHREGDIQAVAACCKAIERESLPLTT